MHRRHTPLVLAFLAILSLPVHAETTAESPKVASAPTETAASPPPHKVIAPNMPSPEQIMTMLKGNLKQLHDKVAPNDKQEKLWASFEDSIIDSNKNMMELVKTVQNEKEESTQKAPNLMAMLARRDQMTEKHMELAKKVRKTLTPFYESLDAKQKDVMDKETMLFIGMFL